MTGTLKLRSVLLATVLAAALPAAARAEGPEIQDFNFYNTDLHLVLKALAEVSGITFVEDVPLTGKVTVHIAKRTPLNEVLEAILKPLALEWRAVGNVYHVGYRKGEQPSLLRPGYVQKVYMLKYVSAGEAARRLRKFLRARGIVSVDRGMNQLTVTMPPNLVDDVENLIKTADIESTRKLISIRMKILEVIRDLTRETGAYLSYNKYNASMGVGSTFADTLNHKRNWGNASSGDWGGNKGNQDEYYSMYNQALTYKVGAWGIDQVVARLRLNTNEDNIKTVTEPDIVVLEGQKAVAKVGQKIPLPTNKYDDAGVVLTITPQVAKDGQITLDVDASVSQRVLTLSAAVSGVDALDNRQVTTKLTMLNGDTGRLGGLLRQDEKVDEYKIPVLGDLPLVGFLFKASRRQTVRRELVILISPSIVEDVPPHGRRSAGISALVAWLMPGTTSVTLDWSEDVPLDNVGVFQYRVYRDVRPINALGRLAPIADAVPRSMSTWVDETPKRRGVTYYYAVIAVDGAGNEQAVSNSPAITVPRR